MSLKESVVSISAMMSRIYDVILGQPAGIPSEFMSSEPTTWLSFIQPGLPVVVDEMEDAASIANPLGKLSAAFAISEILDTIPAPGTAIWSKTDKAVSNVWDNIVHTAQTSKEPDPEAYERYKKAQEYLMAKKVLKLPDGTEQDLGLKETDIYKTYKKLRDAYIAADANLKNQRLNVDRKYQKLDADGNVVENGLSTAEGQMAWDAVSTSILNQKDSAYDDWESAGKDWVEQQLDIMNTSIGDAALYALRQAQDAYDKTSKYTNPITNVKQHLTFPDVANWYSDDVPMTTIEITKNEYESKEVKKKTSTGGRIELLWGLWSVGVGAGGSKENNTFHSEATNIDMKMSLAQIGITRPWMDPTFLELQGWKYGDNPPGKISTGALPNMSALIPLLPVSFIVARDIEISADWSAEDKSYIERAVSGGLSIGYAFFKIGGTVEHSESEEAVKTQFDGTTIKVPGPQIIAIKNHVLPLCPPEAA